jgi:hypothetical protein
MRRIICGTMFMAAVLLLAVAPSAPASAEGDSGSPEDNAKTFLASLTTINEDILGEQKLHFIMFGQSLGTATVTVGKAEHNGAPCYEVGMVMEMAIGEYNTKMSASSLVSAGLQLLHSESSEEEMGEVTSRATVTLTDGTYTFESVSLEDDETTTFEVEAQPRMLLDGAQLLANLLLPAETGKSYEFLDVSEVLEGTYTFTVEVAEVVELRGERVLKMIEHGKSFDVDVLGNVEEEATETVINRAGHKVVRIKSDFLLDSEAPPKMTRISDDEINSRTAEVHPVLMFFHAATENSREKMTQATNAERFLDMLFLYDDDLANLPPEQQEMVRAMFSPSDIIDGLLEGFRGEMGEQSEAEMLRGSETMKLLLPYRELYIVRAVEGDTHAVRFGPELADVMGPMEFFVEKHDDKWQVIWVASGDDVVEFEEEEEVIPPPPVPSEDDEVETDEDDF